MKFLSSAASAVAVLVVLAVRISEGTTCPDLLSERSDYVKSSFNPKFMEGLWYEHNYIDIAQVGSTCQRLNGTYFDATKVLNMDFSVQYGPLPFTITEIYNPPANASEANLGYYIKRANMPGSKLLLFPTVIVDATLNATTNVYDKLIMHSCTVKLDILVQEIVIATRNKMEDPSVLQAMQAEAKKEGVQWDAKNMKTVDWTSKECEKL